MLQSYPRLHPLEETAVLAALGLDADLIAAVEDRAATIAVRPDEWLTGAGLLTERARLAALGKALALPVTDRIDGPLLPLSADSVWRRGPAQFQLSAAPDGRLLVTPMSPGLSGLARRDLPAPLTHCALVGEGPLREAVLARNAGPILDAATGILARTEPDFSAVPTGKRARLATLAGIGLISGTVSAALVAPTLAAGLVMGAIVGGLALFGAGLLVRAAALLGAYLPLPASTPVTRDADLPRATVLLALYQETETIPQLASALQALDYPRSKLEILALVEADDDGTRAAIAATSACASWSVITVPDGRPRTKPRALQVGLLIARGEIVTVYDAEDRPAPSQLRHAAGALRDGGYDCVQAPLHVRPESGWLQRQFALEYDAHFRVLLPGLARWGWPIPLGGTSNVFRTDALRAVYGWDPWNVTEDADLGIRLARRGFRVGTITPPTFEDAPHTLRIWINQRRRWMKGYIQTLLVHGFRPHRTVRDLGWAGTAAMLSVLGGTVVSGLVFPPSIILMAISHALPPEVGPGASLITACRAVFWGGVATPMAVAALARGRDTLGDWRTILSMPLYWLLVSWASYRAVVDLLVDPFHWHKTPHRAPPRPPPQRRARKFAAARSGSVTSKVETNRPSRSSK